MWDTAATEDLPLSHDLPCPRCGHAVHTILPCSDACDCISMALPGAPLLTA